MRDDGPEEGQLGGREASRAGLEGGDHTAGRHPLSSSSAFTGVLSSSSSEIQGRRSRGERADVRNSFAEAASQPARAGAQPSVHHVASLCVACSSEVDNS